MMQAILLKASVVEGASESTCETLSPQAIFANPSDILENIQSTTKE
ncbi:MULTISPECIES: hypothetical protein [Argonema]|nr:MULTISPECIES: hypothetical protein [Argonema]MCL1465870.1 hypothetical protein [Argonema galeatum A003/A1]MCL1472503.1 hypothetical protein [Argonema antarcticum A004/B2]